MDFSANRIDDTSVAAEAITEFKEYHGVRVKACLDSIRQQLTID